MDYTEYEHAVVKLHAERSECNVYHWSNVPEEWLFESGYINDFNRHRLTRIMYKKENKGYNRLRDFGFDGLAKENGIYHSIQAKYYTDSVCANDLGTFFAYQMNLSLINKDSKGFLYTSSKLQIDLKEMIDNPCYPIKHICFPWKKEQAPVPEIALPDCYLPLRGYQKEAIDLINTEGINAVNIPCRMGKTLIAGHDIKNKESELIIAIAPLRISVENLQTRLKCFVPDYKYLLVDSDNSGTTDPKEVKDFLQQEGKKIIYSTYKSTLDVINKCIEDLTKTSSRDILANSYILVDEVHNASEELCDFINLFNDGLVLSATLPDEVMCNLDINEIYTKTFAEAIREGYIVDYNLWLPHLENDTVAVDIPDDFTMYEKSLSAKVFYLASVMLNTGSRRCIVYLERQEDCDAFSIIAKDVFERYHGLDIWTNKIDATVNNRNRTRIINEFQSGDDTVFRILTSVRILDEAVDIPRCDSVFITKVGEQSSDIRMMQRSQRSSTKDISNPNKKNNIILWCEGWESCVGSLERLREGDPEFHKKVRIGISNYTDTGKKEVIDIVEKERGEFIKWNNMKCISVMDKHILMIDKIAKFYDANKRKPSKKSENEEERSLGHWLGHRRNDKNKNKLDKKLEALINERLPWYEWRENQDVIWENHMKTIDKIAEFYEVNNKSPSYGSENKEERSLGYWLGDRKGDKKKNKLDKKLEALINERLPWYEWRDIIWENHMKTIDKIAEFYKINKRKPSRGSENEEEKSLGCWLSVRKGDKNKNKLDKKLEALINERLPWYEWIDIIWENHMKTLNKIAKFYETNNRKPSKKSKKEEEKSLGYWLSRRKGDKKKNKLDKKLEAIINQKLPWYEL
jgi:superfamily II DNA or RNA helicase